MSALGVASRGGCSRVSAWRCSGARGAGIDTLASAIPYPLELIALRLVSAATFSILRSLEPAIAAPVGLVALGQALGAVEVAAVGCVVVASAGAARAASA